jgi:hypothetical protein
MSGEESDPIPAPGGADPGPDAGKDRPLVESASDLHETWMTYDPSSRVPRFVVVVWVGAMIGLCIYLAMFYFADLGRWGRP